MSDYLPSFVVRQNGTFRGVGLRVAAAKHLTFQLVSVGFDLVFRKLSNSIDDFDYFPLISEFCSSVSARIGWSLCVSSDWRFSRSRSSCILDEPWAWRQSFRRCDLSTRCLICSSTCESAYIIYNPTSMYTSILLQASRLFQ